jgi:hypothetical protein
VTALTPKSSSTEPGLPAASLGRFQALANARLDEKLPFAHICHQPLLYTFPLEEFERFVQGVIIQYRYFRKITSDSLATVLC